MSLGIQSLDELVQSVEDDSVNCDRLVVIVYGGPGSGKTTISSRLVDKLNMIHENGSQNAPKSPKCTGSVSGTYSEANSIFLYESVTSSVGHFATHIKMDGFHYPLNNLTADQVKRRGSPGTFDAKQVVELFRLFLKTDWKLLSIPDFDHKTKDPINKSIWLSHNTKVVVFEGLYLMLEDPPWGEIAEMINRHNNGTSSIKIKVVKINSGDTKLRVAQRHLDSGIVHSIEEGLQKYYDNDCINSKLVGENSNDDLCDYIFDNSKDIR